MTSPSLDMFSSQLLEIFKPEPEHNGGGAESVSEGGAEVLENVGGVEVLPELELDQLELDPGEEL